MAKTSLNFFEYKSMTDAEYLNIITYDNIYSRLRNLALSMFEWKGLPESCNFRFLEKTLFENGVCGFIKDPNKGFLNLRTNRSGSFNIYGEPKSWRCYGMGEAYSHSFPAYYMNVNTDTGELIKNGDVCVPIRNNIDMTPTDAFIRVFTYRLTQIVRTIDININAQRTPFVAVCTQQQQETVKAILDQYKNNEEFILKVKNALDINQVLNVIKTDAPFNADKMTQIYHDRWNEALTFLGIDNTNMDKKERMITDEVESNEQHITSNTNVMLLTRKEGAETINKVWDGLNVSVNLREFNRDELQPPDDGGTEDE